MIKWINFLHFYQPPTAIDDTIKQIAKECYQPLVDFLFKYKNTKITINISGCLAQRLFDLGYKKLLKDFSKLAECGQIEFVSSAAFHSILPLLPEKEIIKQTKINNEINKKHFGTDYNPKGFFLPEMAYSEKVGQIIKKLDFKYTILDQIAYDKSLKSQINNNIKYKIQNGLQIIFRNRKISQTFVPETIISLLKQNSLKKQTTIITATDGELYGHRYWNWRPSYSKVIKNKNIKTLTISEYLKTIKTIKTIKPKKSSWESTEKELNVDIPFALWDNPKNAIHKKLWQLAKFALKLNYSNEKDINHFASRTHLEKGLASCTFWWASKKDFKLFSPQAWDPSMVEKGAHELLNSIRSLNKLANSNKLHAEKLFSEIRNLVWKKHWKTNEKKHEK